MRRCRGGMQVDRGRNGSSLQCRGEGIAALPAKGRCGTKEMMQPCLIYLHVISLVASSLQCRGEGTSPRSPCAAARGTRRCQRAPEALHIVNAHRQCTLSMHIVNWTPELTTRERESARQCLSLWSDRERRFFREGKALLWNKPATLCVACNSVAGAGLKRWCSPV